MLSTTPQINTCSKALSLYALTTLASLGILTLVMQLWRADWNVPFAYTRDALFTAMLVKGVGEQGWFLHNPALGMPGGQSLLDFPLTDDLHLLALRILAAVLPTWGMAMNVYYVLSFPLAAVSATAVLRRCGVGSPCALLGGLLFAFLPYHFGHGEAHLFLSMYFLVPPVMLLCLWAYAGQLNTGRRLLLGTLVCVALAWSGVYYAVFAIYLLLAAGAAAALRERHARLLLPPALLAGVILFAMAVAVAPTLLSWHAQGRNPEAAQRQPAEAEVFGLKLTQMVLPLTRHRLPFLAHLKKHYNDSTLFVNENDNGTLGLIGTAGLTILLGVLVIRRPANTLPPALEGTAVVTLFAVLLGTVGGLGSWLAVVVSPEIRAYDRISIFIGFGALLAASAGLDATCRAAMCRMRSPWSVNLLLLFLLALGIDDQTSAVSIPNYTALNAVFESDQRFVQQIEASVPAQSMIFELPYVPFPESPPMGQMSDYQLVRGYLHSSRLRWSYGAMRGRPADLWQHHVSSEPPAALERDLSGAGFAGIYIDRQGYGDGGNALALSLAQALRETPLVSSDARLLFFRLR